MCVCRRALSAMPRRQKNTGMETGNEARGRGKKSEHAYLLLLLHGGRGRGVVLLLLLLVQLVHQVTHAPGLLVQLLRRRCVCVCVCVCARMSV